MPGDERVPTNPAGPPGKPAEARSRALYVMAAAVAVALVVIGLPRCGWVQKTRLDREVDRLCAIDGGVHVYEVVRLPKENFGPDGEVFPQYRSQVASGGGLGPDYLWQTKTKQIVVGDPSLTRWEQTITRVLDGKLLARRVNYVRGGGDLPGPAAPSSHSCPNVPLDLTQQLFVTGN